MLSEKIQKLGYKLTQPRISVLKVLESSCSPSSAKEIYQSLKKRIDLASVYRSLKLFSELELIKSETIKDEKKYFIGKEHHHIVCRKCDAIKCVPCEEQIINIKGYKDVHHELKLTGTCSKCSQKI